MTKRKPETRKKDADRTRASSRKQFDAQDRLNKEFHAWLSEFEDRIAEELRERDFGTVGMALMEAIEEGSILERAMDWHVGHTKYIFKKDAKE